MLCLAAAAASAVDVREVRVERHGARYSAAVEATLAGSPERVRAVLVDFADYQRIHPTILTSEPLGPTPAGAERVRVTSRPCVLLVCFDLVDVMDFREAGHGHLLADMVPGQSDFRYGHFEWELAPEGAAGTRLRFHTEVEPDFWVPPVVGPWLLKRKLRGLATGIAENLELLAAESAR